MTCSYLTTINIFVLKIPAELYKQITKKRFLPVPRGLTRFLIRFFFRITILDYNFGDNFQCSSIVKLIFIFFNIVLFEIFIDLNI